MKILILNHNLRERGTYFRARKIAQGLHARGHEVTFVCAGTGWYRARVTERTERWIQWETGSWTTLHFEEGYSPVGLLQRLAGLNQHWDLIYTFSHFPADQWTARWLRSRGVFWMTDWCDLWNSQQGGLHDWRNWSEPYPDFMHGWRGRIARANFRWEDRLEASAAQRADAVSIIVRPMRRFTRKLGIPDDKVLHLVSGSDTENIAVRDRVECRRALNLPQDRPIIAYIANVTPDNEILERALRRVWQHLPNAVVISAGPRWFSPDGFLDKQVLWGRLRDYGRVPFSEIPYYLGAADVCAMPMRTLPFNECRWPNKFGDYLAAGRATAANDLGDPAAIIRKYGAGAAGEELGEALLTILNNPDQRFQMEQKARKVAENALSWTGQIDRLVHFLHRRGIKV